MRAPVIGRIGELGDRVASGSRPAWMPAPRVPARVSDLWSDLVDRRLLPVVIALLAGIVATPVLLSRGAEAPAPAPPAKLDSQGGGAPAVVHEQPVLRDPDQRLRATEGHDPFRQQLEAAAPRTDAAVSVDAQVKKAITEVTGSVKTGGSSPVEKLEPARAVAPEKTAEEPVRILVGEGEKRRAYELAGDEGTVRKLIKKLAGRVDKTLRIVIGSGERRRIYKLQLLKVSRIKQ